MDYTWKRLFIGKPLSASELNNAFYDLDVQETEINKLGVHTIIELDNIAFVYREKGFKDGSTELISKSPVRYVCKPPIKDDLLI